MVKSADCWGCCDFNKFGIVDCGLRGYWKITILLVVTSQCSRHVEKVVVGEGTKVLVHGLRQVLSRSYKCIYKSERSSIDRRPSCFEPKRFYLPILRRQRARVRGALDFIAECRRGVHIIGGRQENLQCVRKQTATVQVSTAWK